MRPRKGVVGVPGVGFPKHNSSKFYGLWCEPQVKFYASGARWIQVSHMLPLNVRGKRRQWINKTAVRINNNHLDVELFMQGL